MEHSECPLTADNMTIFSLSLSELFGGQVTKFQKKSSCEVVFLFFDDFRIFRGFIWNRRWSNVFVPFTRIGIFSAKNEDFRRVLQWEIIHEDILMNALYVHFGRVLNQSHFQVEGVLTQEIITYSNNRQLWRSQKLRNQYLLHPLFDKKRKIDKDFKISLFHCPPHVVKLDDRRTLDSYDGAEIRFVKEFAQNWNVTIYDRHHLFHHESTYAQVAEDVQFGKTNMALCSMWLTINTYKTLELSNSFGHLCGTFLVPRPKALTQVSYMYLPLSPETWAFVFLSLIVTSGLYFFMFRFWDHQQSNNDAWENMSRTFLDLINIVTSHGVPKVLQRTPVQILLMSWLILSLLISTFYSSKFTSLLALPRYTTPVDSIQDFIDQGLIWGEVGEQVFWRQELPQSGDPLLIKLLDRLILEKNLTERLEYIPTGRYARYVKVLSNNYVTDTGTFPELLHHLRLMKSCMGRYYTVFAFNKNSPYSGYINQELGRYVDSGIVDYWFRLMSIKLGNVNMSSLFDPKRDAPEKPPNPEPLKVSNLFGAFYLIGLGLTLSTVVYLLEIYVEKRKTKKRRRRGV